MDNLLSTVIRQWNLISMFNTSDENYRTGRAECYFSETAAEACTK